MDHSPTPLQESIRLQGDWLFRWRSYTPLPLLGGLLAWIALFPPVPGEEGLVGSIVGGLAIPVGVLGIVIRCWVGGIIPGGTSGRGTLRQRADELNRTGPYSVTRNPLYLGTMLMWVSGALMTHHLSAAVLTIAYFWFCYERIIVAEERFLVGQFGEAYRDWAAETPALLPRLAGYTRGALPFSFRTALKREYSGMLGLVVTLWVMNELGGWRATGVLPHDRGWNIALGTAAVGYVALLTLKKRTRLLHTEGR